jgi:hypothetical protein
MANQCPRSRPISTEHAPFHETYVSLINETNILETLESQLQEVVSEWSRIDPKISLERHAPYTWSLREVIGHINDAERIFGYRALRFARGDATELPGFEENDYVRNADFDRCEWRTLIDEFQALRRANILMLGNLQPSTWMNAGKASGHRVTVHALAYIMAGHVRHHQKIIRKRLKQPEAVFA